MNEEGAEFITWVNPHSGRFLAKKSTIEKIIENKFSNRNRDEKIAIDKAIDSEIINISNNNLTTDEIRYEMDVNKVNEIEINKTRINRNQINLVDEVLYNKNFDLNILFKN